MVVEARKTGFTHQGRGDWLRLIHPAQGLLTLTYLPMTIQQEEVILEHFESLGMTRGDAQGRFEAMSEAELDALLATLTA